MRRRTSTLTGLLTRLLRPRPKTTKSLLALGGALRKLYTPAPAAKAKPARAARSATRVPSAAQQAAGRDEGAFSRKYFSFEGQRRPYRLFVPAGPSKAPPPLLVMLHGCKQDAADFATGTRMNLLAASRHFVVAYPEQLQKANSMCCWNWFERRNQARSGEAAWLAAFAQAVAKSTGADASRVYIAGLSAGGAMALVVANQYPDVFAAVGVHSGLAQGEASNVMGALRVMRHGPSAASRMFARAVARPGAAPMPTFVAHGDADSTVHPRNGEAVTWAAEEGVRTALAPADANGEVAGLQRVEDTVPATHGRRPARRSRLIDSRGECWVESWVIDAAPHAWAGGAPEGSYTDPAGPDVSVQLVDFLLRHTRAIMPAEQAVPAT